VLLDPSDEHVYNRAPKVKNAPGSELVLSPNKGWTG
jgi:hypothetical protein